MLALLRRCPPPDWGHLQALARPRQLRAIRIMMPRRAAEAPTLGCQRISRGCQVQPKHADAATKHAVTPQCTGSESRPHMSPSTRKGANSSSRPLKVAKEHTALSGLRFSIGALENPTK